MIDNAHEKLIEDQVNASCIIQKYMVGQNCTGEEDAVVGSKSVTKQLEHLCLHLALANCLVMKSMSSNKGHYDDDGKGDEEDGDDHEDGGFGQIMKMTMMMRRNSW